MEHDRLFSAVVCLNALKRSMIRIQFKIIAAIVEHLKICLTIRIQPQRVSQYTADIRRNIQHDALILYPFIIDALPKFIGRFNGRIQRKTVDLLKRIQFLFREEILRDDQLLFLKIFRKRLAAVNRRTKEYTDD